MDDVVEAVDEDVVVDVDVCVEVVVDCVEEDEVVVVVDFVSSGGSAASVGAFAAVCGSAGPSSSESGSTGVARAVRSVFGAFEVVVVGDAVASASAAAPRPERPVRGSPSSGVPRGVVVCGAATMEPAAVVVGRAAIVALFGRRAMGSSVIWCRTLPTAADATNTAASVVAIHASTIPTRFPMTPSCRKHGSCPISEG